MGHHLPEGSVSFQLSHLGDAVGQAERHSFCSIILHVSSPPLGLDALLHVVGPRETLGSGTPTLTGHLLGV